MGRRRNITPSRIASSDAGVTIKRTRFRAGRVLPVLAFLAAMGLVLAVVIAPSQVQNAYAVSTAERVKAQSLAVASGFSAVVTRDTYKVTKKVVVPPPVILAAVSVGAPAVGKPDPGSAKAIAFDMIAARGWGNDQFSCLVSLYNKESGWNTYAANSSGAYGIPQALPGSKMASAGADWATNPATQISWGLGYITARYGTPCDAWSHSVNVGWY